MDEEAIYNYITDGDEESGELKFTTDDIVKCLEENTPLGLYFTHHLLQTDYVFEDKKSVFECIFNLLYRGDFDDSEHKISQDTYDSISGIIAIIELDISPGKCEEIIAHFRNKDEHPPHLRYRLNIMNCLLSEQQNHDHHHYQSHMPEPWPVLRELDDEDSKIFLAKDEVRYGIEAYIFDRLEDIENNNYAGNNYADNNLRGKYIEYLSDGLDLICSHQELEDYEEVATGHLSRYLHTLSQTCFFLTQCSDDEKVKIKLLIRTKHLLNAALIYAEDDETHQFLSPSALFGSKVDNLPWDEITRVQVEQLIDFVSIALGGDYQ
ncbi:MAG: hypothetical protein HOH79_00145 [Euryarchaeota archaeon]|jgi:hypothetical protein|nr:hypothetical protein [Euryarchaeota archaeon]MBT5843378.1 hypothetical protein [Euryarchaeota archaeon]MBT6844536.1 hypothetical protein [Euryarchaeota archaeon]